MAREMLFSDALTLDAPRRTADGYLAVRAHAARTGAYQYSGRNVDPENKHGMRDQATVNIARDADDVFDAASLGSFVGKPITDDHPTEAVNAGNWRQHARGVVMGAVKDGEKVGFDLAFLDAGTIAKLEAGKVELSNGYTCDLEFGDFTASDGTKCQARQTNIRGNHVALVDRGRAGSECRVNIATCDSIPLPTLKTEKPVITMLIDGLTVDVSNAETAKATIATILAARDGALAKVSGLETQVATLTTDKATLEGKVKELTDAKPTPAQLRDAAKQFAAVTDKAKALGVTVTDSMDEADIMKAAVLKHVGDAAKDWNDVQIGASFATMQAKDAKTVSTVPNGNPANLNDGANAWGENVFKMAGLAVKKG